MPTSPLPLQRYWNLAAAPVETAALDAALELDLFAHLVTPASAAQVAQALALRPAAAEHLLDLLWGLRLLHRIAGEPTLYRCGATARAHFLAGRPGYCGDAWRYRRRVLAQSGEQLMQRLRQDPATALATPPGA
ncbi:methyltransferase family protein, partial [Achromobacter pulmonis]|uniref:methyltransferase family protein n=2 Tax=Alcaligenaceae TaxID=506 RepID=UPI003C77ED81